MYRNDYQCSITGARGGVAASAVLLLIFGAVTAWLYASDNGAALIGFALCAAAAAVFSAAVYRAVFF